MDPEDFKSCLRRFASGVTVVTVGSPENMHGMTASSFASVSLDPPLVLVCLSKSSKTYEFIQSTQRFAINILSVGQETVARSFALQGPKDFGEIEHQVGELGAPLLDEAIAWLECRTHDVIAAGDHYILVGLVESCATREGTPVVYYDGGYRSLD